MTQTEKSPALEGKRNWEARLLSALSDYTKLNQIVDALAQPFTNSQVDKVACFEALGFPLGAGVALALRAGLVLVRKTEREEDPLDFETESFCDYDGNRKTFKILKRVVPNRSRILIVDDLLESGEQLRAASTLLKRLGAIVMGAAFISCKGPLDVKLDPCYGFPVHHLNGGEAFVPSIARQSSAA
jgi:adenine phosphoribosyltransferase